MGANAPRTPALRSLPDRHASAASADDFVTGRFCGGFIRETNHPEAEKLTLAFNLDRLEPRRIGAKKRLVPALDLRPLGGGLIGRGESTQLDADPA